MLATERLCVAQENLLGLLRLLKELQSCSLCQVHSQHLKNPSGFQEVLLPLKVHAHEPFKAAGSAPGRLHCPAALRPLLKNCRVPLPTH